jgi:TRAP-type C4-dicarboxylate transport system permease small subunit
MRPRTGAFGRFGRAGEALLGIVAGAILFAMMALTAVDVFQRYVMGVAIRGAFEVTELMMVVLIFAGLPLVSLKDEHVTVDLLDHVLPAPVRRGLRALGHLVAGVALVGMSWLLWRKAGQVVEYGDVTAALQLALWPFVYLMSGLSVVTALIHFYMIFRRPGLPGRG